MKTERIKFTQKTIDGLPLPTSGKKEFFRESDWERRKTSNDVPDYIFNITKNDLEISE